MVNNDQRNENTHNYAHEHIHGIVYVNKEVCGIPFEEVRLVVT